MKRKVLDIDKIGEDMTRKEILHWGRDMADKIFHGHHKEVRVKGHIQIVKGKCFVEDEYGRRIYVSAFILGDIAPVNEVEIIIRKV